MPVKAVTGGQGRIRGRRAGAQQGTGGTPSPPAPDPSFGVAFGTGGATGTGAYFLTSTGVGAALGTSSVSGAGNSITGGASAETAQFFDRLINLPSTTRQSQYAALIDGLVSDGVWSSLDVLCVAGADVATSMINLVQAPFSAEYSANPADFVADRGFLGDNSLSKWIVTNFNPQTAGGHFVQDSAFMGAWNLGSEAHNYNLINSGSTKIELYPSDAGQLTSGINSQFEDTSISNSVVTGFFSASRTSSTSYDVHANGVLLASLTRGSTTMSSGNIIVATALGVTDWRIAAWIFGGGLTATKAVAVYNRIHTYLAAIGAV
jgi:hypothetical protein